MTVVWDSNSSNAMLRGSIAREGLTERILYFRQRRKCKRIPTLRCIQLRDSKGRPFREGQDPPLRVGTIALSPLLGRGWPSASEVGCGGHAPPQSKIKDFCQPLPGGAFYVGVFSGGSRPSPTRDQSGGLTFDGDCHASVRTGSQ